MSGLRQGWRRWKSSLWSYKTLTTKRNLRASLRSSLTSTTRSKSNSVYRRLTRSCDSTSGSSTRSSSTNSTKLRSSSLTFTVKRSWRRISVLMTLSITISRKDSCSKTKNSIKSISLRKTKSRKLTNKSKSINLHLISFSTLNSICLKDSMKRWLSYRRRWGSSRWASSVQARSVNLLRASWRTLSTDSMTRSRRSSPKLHNSKKLWVKSVMVLTSLKWVTSRPRLLISESPW